MSMELAQAASEETSRHETPGMHSSFVRVIDDGRSHGRLHALHPGHPGQQAAVTGFAIAMCLSLQRSRHAPVLWVQERQCVAEAGRPCGHGLAGLGLDPSRLVVVTVKGAMAALAAAEMGLEEAGLAGVLVDLPSRLPSGMLRLGKRLSLRAERQGAPCFLLHAGIEPVESPVATRWHVTSGAMPRGKTHWSGHTPADFSTVFDLTLSKNRFGPLGRFRLRWGPTDPSQSMVRKELGHVAASVRFAFSDVGTPLLEPLATETADRPPGTPQDDVGNIRPWQTAA